MTPVRTIELFTFNSTNIDAIQLYYSDTVSASGMKQRIGQFQRTWPQNDAQKLR
jgi:hypothetical protein